MDLADILFESLMILAGFLMQMTGSVFKEGHEIFLLNHTTQSARGTAAVKVLCYKPKGREFGT
jgi:hypothetical protein